MVWIVTPRMTWPPWYTTGIGVPAATSLLYGGMIPIRPPIRGRNLWRAPAGAAHVINTESATSDPIVQQSLLLIPTAETLSHTAGAVASGQQMTTQGGWRESRLR